MNFDNSIKHSKEIHVLILTNPCNNLDKSIEKTHKCTHLNSNKARRSTLRQAGCGLMMLMMRICLRASPEKILLWDCNRSGEGRGEEQWHTARWLLPRRPARPQWNYKNGPPQCLDGLTTSTGILSHVKSQSLKNSLRQPENQISQGIAMVQHTPYYPKIHRVFSFEERRSEITRP